MTLTRRILILELADEPRLPLRIIYQLITPTCKRQEIGGIVLSDSAVVDHNQLGIPIEYKIGRIHGGSSSTAAHPLSPFQGVLLGVQGALIDNTQCQPWD